MQTVPTLMAHTTASANLDLLEMVPVVQVGVLLETLRFEDEQEKEDEIYPKIFSCILKYI